MAVVLSVCVQSVPYLNVDMTVSSYVNLVSACFIFCFFSPLGLDSVWISGKHRSFTYVIKTCKIKWNKIKSQISKYRVQMRFEVINFCRG